MPADVLIVASCWGCASGTWGVEEGDCMVPVGGDCTLLVGGLEEGGGVVGGGWTVTAGGGV